MKTIYVLLQVCECCGSFVDKKTGKKVDYSNRKAWVAVDDYDDTGKRVCRYTKEYKASEHFVAKLGTESELLVFDEKGRLYAFT